MNKKIVVMNFSAALIQEDCIKGKNTGAHYYDTQKKVLFSHLKSEFPEENLTVIGFNTDLKFRIRNIDATEIIQYPGFYNSILSSFLFNIVSFLHLLLLRPSLIYAYTDGLLYPYMGTSFYSKLFSVPFFVDLRNPPYSLYINESTSVYKRIGIKITDYICMRFSNVLIHVSENAKEMIKKKRMFYEKSIVVPSCAPEILFEKKKVCHINKDVTFATWGVINKPRKLELIIKAFIRAQELNPKSTSKFFVIGEGDDLDNLKEIVKTSKISNIIFKGYMDQNKLFDFLSNVSVAVIPIPPENTFYLVSSPLKLAEAVTLEMPIIASAIKPNNIVDACNLGILSNHDIESYAQAFIQFENFSESKMNKYQTNCKNIKYIFKPSFIFKDVTTLIQYYLYNH